MTLWTVQCGYAAYYAHLVVVEAGDLITALDQAIAQANADPYWTALDHCGPTFIDAVAPGERDPWDGTRSVLPIPPYFREAGAPPEVLIALARGRIEKIWLRGGAVRVSVRDYEAGAHARAETCRRDRAGRPYLLTRWVPEFPPRRAEPKR